jgi:hypothetical protein
VAAKKKVIVAQKELDIAFADTDPDVRYILDTISGMIRKVNERRTAFGEEEEFSRKELERTGHYIPLPHFSREERKHLIENFAGLQAEEAVKTALTACLKQSNPSLALKTLFFDQPELRKGWLLFQGEMLRKKIASILEKEGLELQFA